MDANGKKCRRSSLKGAVLFTVLAVMMVVLALLLSAIALAGAASKRAYKEYHDAQIAATGKSIVNSVLSSFNPETGENSELGQTVYKEVMDDTDNPYTIYVSDGGELGNGLGKVEKIEFLYAGIDKPGEFFIKGSGNPIMKVTATVRMGNEVTTYTQYVSDMVFVPGGGGDGGLLSTNAIGATGTGMNVLGPVGGGLNNGVAKGSSTPLKTQNVGIYTGVQFFNDSIYVNTAKTFLYDKNVPASSYGSDSVSNYQGLFVLGNVSFENDKAAFLSDYKGVSAKETPYIFATGEINFMNGMYIGSCQDTLYKTGVSESGLGLSASEVQNRLGNKVNTYCGWITTQKNGADEVMNVIAVSDIYCYNNNETSVITGVAQSPLTEWAGDVTGKAQKLYNNSIHGDFVTKGGLTLGGNNSSIHITGNVIVEKRLTVRTSTDATKQPKIDGRVSAHVIDISGANVTNEEELKNLLGCTDVKFDYLRSDGKIYNSSYEEVTGTTIDAVEGTALNITEKFPANKELEQILGLKFNSSGLSGKEQLDKINSQEYTIAGVDLTNKIIQNPSEMSERFYEIDGEGNRVLKGSVSGSGADSLNKFTFLNGRPQRNGFLERNGVYYVSVTESEYNACKDKDNNMSKVTVNGNQVELAIFDGVNYYKYIPESIPFNWNETSKQLVITESCSLSGFIQNANIIVRPGTDASNPLWIELDNVDISNSSIIVEDIIKQDGAFVKNGVCNKAAPVYFYIKDGSTNKFDKSRIVTEYYEETYFKGSRKISETLVIPSTNIPEALKPNVYIYGSNKEKDDTGKFIRTEQLIINNESVVTAYIVAPRVTLDVKKAGLPGADVNYNEKTYKGLAVGIIGSAIVGDVADLENDVTLVYVNNNDGAAKDPLEMFGYSPVPGFTSY